MENRMKLFKKFRKDENGAVTVDWVVLTAAIVGLGVAVMTTVRGGTEGLAGRISEGLDSVTVDAGSP
jgi:Flp pilus assembly pilin Flp